MTSQRLHIRHTKKGKPFKAGRNYRAFLYHGTSEEGLARMTRSEGLRPSGGKLYLTDDPGYARLRARMASKESSTNPIVIKVEEPSDIQREGRHFVSKQTIPSRRFEEVYVP